MHMRRHMICLCVSTSGLGMLLEWIPRSLICLQGLSCAYKGPLIRLQSFSWAYKASSCAYKALSCGCKVFSFAYKALSCAYKGLLICIQSLLMCIQSLCMGYRAFHAHARPVTGKGPGLALAGSGWPIFKILKIFKIFKIFKIPKPSFRLRLLQI